MSVTLSGNVTMTRTDNALVLLDERSGQYWQINESGAAAMDALLAGSTVDGAAKIIVERYEVDLARAEQDIRSLVECLRDRRLIA